MAPTKDGMDTEQNEDEGSYSLARSRSRREVKKSQKSSAFERLRKAKEEGVKNRYELEEEKNVYDVVDEGEYSEMVRQRQDDDWIVDDDGAGYVEDGREIFDDEMDEDAPVASKKKKQDKTKNKNIVRPGTKPKQDIKSMFAAASVTSKKKSEKEATLADDDILQGLMGNIGKGTSSSLGLGSGKKASDPAKQVKRTQYNPFKTEGKSTKSTPPTPVVKKELSYSPLPKSSPMPTKSVFVKQEPPSPKPKAFQKPMPTEPAQPKTCLPAEVKADILPVLDDDTDLSGFDFSEEMDIPEDEGSEKVVEPAECKKKLPSEELLTRGWENISSEDASESSPSASVQVDSSQLPLVTNSTGEKVLRFYWLDAYEDSYNQPGVVFLFGKVYIEKAKTYASCCVTVKNIERQLFLLPRIKKVNVKTGVESDEEVTMPQVYEEFDRLAEKHRILKFKSMKVKRSYAFEKAEVPAEADYLAIRYAADMPALPSDLKGETFSHVFGTNTSSLELLLVGRRMKGPAWLDLRCPQMSKVSTSWCKFEAEVTRPDHVAISDCTMSPPPLVLMTLNLRTLPNAKTKQNEIVAVSCLINSKFYMDKPAPRNQPFERHFCVVTPPNDCVFPFDFRDQVKSQSGRMKIEVMPTERGLVAFLLAKIHREDPDLIVGHDIYGFDLDILLHRISANKIPHWSKISRLKRSVMPKLTHSHGRATFAEKSAVCGRIMCDVQISAKELIRCRSYDLTELTSQVLKEKRTELDYDEFRESFLKSQELLKALELTLFDSSFILRIMYELNTIPLALQITNICGNVMSRTLMGGRSERNEWLLLHAFQEKQYICPDKEFKKKQQPVIANEDGDDNEGGATAKTVQGKRKPAYAGGLVLEPKKGFYDTFILLLDFNSLYPSIIQEYNICFTTISRSSSPEEMDNEDESNLILPDLDLEPGVLPTEIRKLVESRKQVKALMKGSDVTADQMMQYDIRQKALKLTANSMYGCLGFSFSRFYAKPLAALVTGKGREILMKTKDLVQNMGLDVIYGDTDSIMINSNSRDMDQVYKLGNRVKTEVNKLYRLLEIDIDGVFKSMLLLKKKKYAALSISKGPDGQVTTTEELKGLDIVRRDWSDLATQAGNYVVSQILSGESRELIVDNIHARLESVAEEVREGKLPVTLFHITKTLTKNPEDYPDKKSLPHVQVALRFNSKGGRKMRGGDTVPYVICEDGSTLSATQRAYHPDELNKQESLHIDYKYYLAHQIHPVVARLCDPIEGTDSARIAECLGLDPSGYRHAARQEEDQGEDLVTLQLTMEERFQDCDRLSIPCPSQSCGRVIVLDSVFNCSGSNVTPVLQACPNPECRQSLLSLKNKLKNLIQLRIQRHVNKYYQGWLKCEDAGCNARTNKMPLIMQRGHPLCASCDRGYLRVEYSDSALYTQLCFYEYVFDVPKAMTFLNDQEKVQARKIRTDVLDVYRELKNHVTRWLDRSAYSNVDLGKLFGGLGLTLRPTVSDVTIKEEKGI